MPQDADIANVLATWSPWPDVHIHTLLFPADEDGRWHARVHWIETKRKLWTAEGGFCVPLDGAVADTSHEADANGAFAEARPLRSGIRDLTGNRTGRVVVPDPNTHLLWPRTLLPTLCGTSEPGAHKLVSLVYADTAGGTAGGTACADSFADVSTLPDLPNLAVFGVPDPFSLR
jgi:hypothetical protein